jgi:hypothetical protein
MSEDPYLVGDLLGRELLLGATNHGDLGDAAIILSRTEGTVSTG